jgi:hypothetical protein
VIDCPVAGVHTGHARVAIFTFCGAIEVRHSEHCSILSDARSGEARRAGKVDVRKRCATEPLRDTDAET